MWPDYIRWSRVFLGIGCDPRVYGRALDFSAACGSTVPILIRRVIQRNRDLDGCLFKANLRTARAFSIRGGSAVRATKSTRILEEKAVYERRRQ